MLIEIILKYYYSINYYKLVHFYNKNIHADDDYELYYLISNPKLKMYFITKKSESDDAVQNFTYHSDYETIFLDNFDKTRYFFNYVYGYYYTFQNTS